MDLGNATPEELAAFGLKTHVAFLCDQLHWAIGDGLSEESLHDIVGL